MNAQQIITAQCILLAELVMQRDEARAEVERLHADVPDVPPQ
jgi:hypothetical protein